MKTGREVPHLVKPRRQGDPTYWSQTRLRRARCPSLAIPISSAHYPNRLGVTSKGTPAEGHGWSILWACVPSYIHRAQPAQLTAGCSHRMNHLRMLCARCRLDAIPYWRVRKPRGWRCGKTDPLSTTTHRTKRRSENSELCRNSSKVSARRGGLFRPCEIILVERAQVRLRAAACHLQRGAC